MRSNIYAHTETHSQYPAYLSINKEDSGQLTVTVRSRGDGGRNVATIEMAPEALEAMAVELMAYLNRAAQPAPVVPDDVARYRTIRNGLAYIEPHESGEIYVAGENGVYTKSGDEFDAAIDAIAAAQQKG